MKKEKTIGIMWLALSFINFYQGCSYIFQYSTPGVLWLFMIPIIIAYVKIVCGVLSLFIAVKFLKNESEYNYMILPITFLLIIYLIDDIIQYGFSTVYYSGENILLLMLIAITFYKLKKRIRITNLIVEVKQNKMSTLGALVLGVMPYILSELITYNFYKFLH